MDSPWAQLVSVTELESSAVPLVKDKFVIGRNGDCDLPHKGNKLVSGRHCYIERDGNGKVWIYDTSTNGTLLNLTIKLSKGECRELHHGDEIHIVHKKSDAEDDIGYMFQDMEALKAELSSDTEETQEYTQIINEMDTTVTDDSVNVVTTPSPLKRKKSVEISSDVAKKIKTASYKKQSSSVIDDAKTKENTFPDASSKEEGCNKTESTLDDAGELHIQKKVSSMPEEKAEPVPKQKPHQEPEEDAIAENLMCIICQELLHDCISLQPCMHSFCAGCYSEWMERSKECPSCRMDVARINKNHIVNNLVEAYLKVKPEKRRPEAELKELDKKNKITRDMLYPTKKSNDEASDCDESYSDDDDPAYSDDDDDDPDVPAAVPVNNFNNFNQGGYVFGIGTPFFGTAAVRPGQTVCRQCRGYRDVQNDVTVALAPQGGGAGGNAAGAGPSTAAGPSTVADDPDKKTLPDPPDYTCQVNGNHVLCLCCMLPMPDRRHQYTHGGTVPPQQCFLCFRSFCHAYWGCRKVDCQGCLAKFKELNFGKKCLTSLVLDNHYESKVLADYMKDQGMSVKDLFQDCLARVNSGDYTFTNQGRAASLNIFFNNPVCYACGLQCFKELAYLYRRDIPADRLPKEVTSRPDCYWGKNCRTQRNKPEHAMRFNHICDQTRTVA